MMMMMMMMITRQKFVRHVCVCVCVCVLVFVLLLMDLVAWNKMYCIVLYCKYATVTMTIHANSVHTADTDKTRQSCLVLSVSAVWTELATRQDSFVLSRPSFKLATVQSQIYWRLLWTVLTCRQFRSHRRHGRDKTALSCPYRWCEIYRITWHSEQNYSHSLFSSAITTGQHGPCPSLVKQEPIFSGTKTYNCGQKCVSTKCFIYTPRGCLVFTPSRTTTPSWTSLCIHPS